MSAGVLIVYYSQNGATLKLANLIARGVNTIDNCDAIVRCVVDAKNKARKTSMTHQEVSLEDLKNCNALALGSPSFYGGMAAPLKAFIDSSTPLWMNGTLVDKPACVFSSSGSHHGGNEMVLISLMVPLLHHGMLIMGIPYTQAALNTTTSGGTPYGPSHVAGSSKENPISAQETELCLATGKRLALACIKLSS